jgi:hypothetical protein
MKIGFFIRHFTERGTEVAAYDYANYNEEILHNKSCIICFTEFAQKRMGFPLERTSYDKFKSRFEIIEINDITDMQNVINHYKLDIFYTLTHGGADFYKFNNKTIWGSCKTIKHCVFDTRNPEGDIYLSISNHLNNSFHTNIQVLPHIVDLPNINENLRDELYLPVDAIVFGRYGGYHQFDLSIASNAIKQFLLNTANNNVYFLFMNTKRFYNHPRIIYLERSVDLIYKTKFINTCDAMIHARRDGETFGLAIAEFSIRNKPIITCPCGDLEHILILKDKAITYNNMNELIDIFSNIKQIIAKHEDWNCYREYTPELVMSQFNNLITQLFTKPNDNINAVLPVVDIN